MKHLLTLLFGASLLVLLQACSSSPELVKLAGSAQGTTWHVTYWTEKEIPAEEIQAAIESELARIDTVLSNYRPDSAISKVNEHQETSEFATEAELVKLIEIARQVSIASQGCYDLTIQPLFKLWGFTRKSLHIPDAASLAETLFSVGIEKVQTHESFIQKTLGSVHVDVSSIGQGYSVERLGQLLTKRGIENFLVEIGGELQTRGFKPGEQAWRIAIERPLPETGGFHKIVTINRPTPTAIMTSGTYRHYYDEAGKRYSHILDARTGKPVTHNTVSVTVIHENPTIADAWSTALLCLGSEAGLKTANKEKLAAYFIDQFDTDTTEFSSDAFRSLNRIRVE